MQCTRRDLFRRYEWSGVSEMFNVDAVVKPEDEEVETDLRWSRLTFEEVAIRFISSNISPPW